MGFTIVEFTVTNSRLFSNYGQPPDGAYQHITFFNSFESSPSARKGQTTIKKLKTDLIMAKQQQ